MALSQPRGQMTTLVPYEKDGLEFLVNQATGEVSATASGYSRMAGVTSQAILKRLNSVLTTTYPNPNGGKPYRLIGEDVIEKWLREDNPALYRLMAQAGVRVFLHQQAGYQVTSSAVVAQKPALTPMAVLHEMTGALLAMEAEVAQVQTKMASVESRLDEMALVLPRQGYSTIGSYCYRLGIKPSNSWKAKQGSKAKALCKEAGRTFYQVPDDRYPKGVGSYPDDILAIMDWSVPEYGHFDPSFAP